MKFQKFLSRCRFALQHQKGIQLADAHYSPAGSPVLAEDVARVIFLEALQP